MTIVRISAYVSDDQIRKLSLAQYARLRTVCLQLPEMPGNERIYASIPELIDLETDGRILSDLGIEFTIRQFKGQVNVVPHMVPEEHRSAQTVHVHVPNVGLLAVDDVMVLEDACTDSLQMRLDDGWRILCVCPPNSVRRPDYILGRTRPRD